MNKVEKIKAEIERRKNQFVSQAESLHKIGKEDKESYYAALASNMNSLSCFLYSLEEEPVSEDLEEAAHLYVNTTIECFDSDGNPCCYPAFIAGAQWQKDTFIEKTCEFFGEHLWEYINVKNANCDTFINIDGDKLIEDFKKYMKGE